MKIWKVILGFLGLVGGLFAAGAAKNKKVKELKKVIKQIKELEESKAASKKEVGNLKRKLTNSKKKTKKMQEAYDNDEVESAEDFLRNFAKNK